jgi:hypothetical protein
LLEKSSKFLFRKSRTKTQLSSRPCELGDNCYGPFQVRKILTIEGSQGNERIKICVFETFGNKTRGEVFEKEQKISKYFITLRVRFQSDQKDKNSHSLILFQFLSHLAPIGNWKHRLLKVRVFILFLSSPTVRRNCCANHCPWFSQKSIATCCRSSGWFGNLLVVAAGMLGHIVRSCDERYVLMFKIVRYSVVKK